jgi:hypothetical protein
MSGKEEVLRQELPASIRLGAGHFALERSPFSKEISDGPSQPAGVHTAPPWPTCKHCAGSKHPGPLMPSGIYP